MRHSPPDYHQVSTKIPISPLFYFDFISHIETNKKHYIMIDGSISKIRVESSVYVVLLKRAGTVAPAPKVYRFTLASKAWRISFLCSRRRTSSSSLFSGIYDSGRVTCPKLI